MRFVKFVVLAVLAFAAPLQAQMKPAVRDSILRTRPVLADPCDRSKNPAIDPMAQKCFWDYTNDSTDHALKYERAVAEARKAHQKFDTWCKLKSDECKKKYPSRFASTSPVKSPSTALNNGIDGGLTDDQIVKGKSDTSVTSSFDDVSSGTGTTESGTVSDSTKNGESQTDSSDRAERLEKLRVDSANALKTRRKTIGRSPVDATATKKSEAAANAKESRERAYELAKQQIIAPGDDPNGHAFAYGILSKEGVLLAIADCENGVQPKVWRVTCAQFLEAMNTYIAPQLKRKPFSNTFLDTYDYIKGLEVRTCKKGFKVFLARIYHGVVNGDWSRSCKPDEQFLYDNQNNIAVMMLSCSNVFTIQPSYKTIRDKSASTLGPMIDENRAGVGNTGQGDDTDNKGFVFPVKKVLVPTGIVALGLGIWCAADPNHWCIGKNKNTNKNDNDNDNTNTVHTQRVQGFAVPLSLFSRLY